MTVLAHGYIRYTHGCRCDECRNGKAAYMRTRRAAARARARRFTDDNSRYLATGVIHGSAASYQEAGCRCRPCTTAITAKRRQERERQRA